MGWWIVAGGRITISGEEYEKHDRFEHSEQAQDGRAYPGAASRAFGRVAPDGDEVGDGRFDATVGERWQIVIPKQARELFGIEAGDALLVLGDEEQGLAILKADEFMDRVSMLRSMVDR